MFRDLPCSGRVREAISMDNLVKVVVNTILMILMYSLVVVLAPAPCSL